MQKIIVITGASGGFGTLMTKSLAGKGHFVFAAMRDPHGKNKAIAQEFSTIPNVSVLELEITSDESVSKAIQEVLRQKGRIDVLINNAGIGNYGISESFTSDQLRDLFDINVFGSFRTVKASLPYMRKQHSGLIIQISSQLGRTVIPLMGLYSGTKFAVEAISESLAEEVEDLGIDVCIVQPGGYPTDFARNSILGADLTQEYGQRVKKSMDSMGHYMESLKSPDAPKSQEVADAVVALVETPHGKRPRRKVVGYSIGAEEINDVSKKVQDQLLGMFKIR